MLPGRLALVAVFATTVGLVSAPAHAAPTTGVDYTDTIRAGRAAMRAAMKDTGATSASIALLSGNKVVWSQRFGEITPRGAKPTANTVYGIGSVSKMVTTAALMQLVDQGKVSLDAPVTRYVPDFTMVSPQYRQITVRMLLNHSAGLPGSEYKDAVSYEPIPGHTELMLRTLSRSALKTTPGAMSVYCNDCFELAGEVVARVSGMSFEEYASKNLFAPLGMTNTGFGERLVDKLAPVIADGSVKPPQYFNGPATGGVMSTPEDMLRLARVFTGERQGIVSPASIAEMGSDQTTTQLKVGRAGMIEYGLGWDDVRDPALADAGVTAWVKGGDVIEQHTSFMVVPEQDLAVVVSSAGERFGSGVGRAVGQQVLLRALVDTGVLKRYPKAVGAPPARVAATRKQVNRMTGMYLSSMNSIRLQPGKRNSLRLSLFKEGAWVSFPGRYVRRADGAFWSTKDPGTSMRRVRAWDRTYLVLRGFGDTGTFYADMVAGQRVRPGRMLPEWSQRAGQRWLMANENPQSVAWTSPHLTFYGVPGLSGYLIGVGYLVGSAPFDAGVSAETGSMFLQVPYVAGRDMFDFSVARHGPEDVLQVGSSVLRQKATVPDLTTGQVQIGTRGFVEWFKAPADMTVSLSGQEAWKAYDDALTLVGSGGQGPTTAEVKAGGYLVLFGAPGTVISVG